MILPIKGYLTGGGQLLTAVGVFCSLVFEDPQLVLTNVLYKSAVKQVLEGTISEKGILAPMTSKINDPLMKELKQNYGLV